MDSRQTLQYNDMSITYNMSLVFASSYRPLSCAHEQKADACMHYVLSRPLSIGMAIMAIKKALFVSLADRVPRFETC